MSRLGLRYRPTNAADLSAHAAGLSLLASDVAEIPADILDRAISRHVNTSPYMPKAADLWRIAKEIEGEERAKIPQQTGRGYAHDLAQLYNSQRTRDDVHWYVDHIGAPKLTELNDKGTPIYTQPWTPQPGEIEAINAKISKLVAGGMTQKEFNALVDQGRI